MRYNDMFDRAEANRAEAARRRRRETPLRDNFEEEFKEAASKALHNAQYANVTNTEMINHRIAEKVTLYKTLKIHMQLMGKNVPLSVIKFLEYTRDRNDITVDQFRVAVNFLYKKL